jgi:diadenosine tetraphosphate (Ap4A) HIT family hydrolase
MNSCTFCRILASELPSSRVLDSNLVVAFLDIRPAAPGHTLVVPRRHVESFTELTAAELADLAICAQRIALAMKRGFEACGAVTFSLADGAAAGQDVPHTHLHVIPRRTGDGLGRRAAGALQDRQTLDATAARLRDAIGLTSKQ